MTNLTNKYWEMCTLKNHLDKMSSSLITYADKLKYYDTDSVSDDIRRKAKQIADDALYNSFEFMQQSKQVYKEIMDLEEQIKTFEIALIKAKEAYQNSQEINAKIIDAIENLL